MKHKQNNNQGYFLPLYTWMPKDKKKTLKEVENRIFQLL